MKKKTDSLAKLAEGAFKQVEKKVIERAKQTGTTVIVSREGKIVELDPHTMLPVKKMRAKRVG